MNNKTIVITGSSSGIGRATAKYFAEKGWNVAATMRNPDKESELQNIDNTKVYQLDVTDEDSITNAFNAIIKDFQKVDVLLNNAGYALAGPFEISTDEQEEIIQECEQLIAWKVDDDGKLKLKPKAEIKQDIGRSPDWRDMLLMREYFELKQHKSALW